jgi:alkylation response protein AidB-like acyl-CoA dehydrogenase
VLQTVLNRAAVLYALQQIGGAERCLELATDYAKTRQAFGQPIGRFQAIKHKLADMLVVNTLARSHAFRGLWALDASPSDLPTAAAAARLAAGEAYWVAARETIQIHGAIGFTWEAGLHAHYRRAHHLSLVLGSADPWRAQLFDGLNRSCRSEADTRKQALLIPWLRDNPKIFGGDDPEVIGDLVTHGAPIFGHVCVQEGQQGGFEVGEAGV